MNDQHFAHLLGVSQHLSSYTETAAFFPGRLLFNLVPQTTVVADSNDQEFLNAIETDQYTTTEEIGRLATKNYKTFLFFY